VNNEVLPKVFLTYDIFKFFNYKNSTGNKHNSKKWYVDSLANMAFTGDLELINNVNNVSIKVETIGGVICINKRGRIPIIGDVYFNDRCQINGIGLCILVDASENNWYLSGDKWIFNIVRGDYKISLTFEKDDIGYGCNLDKQIIDKLEIMEKYDKYAMASNKLVSITNTTMENEQNYNKNEREKAKLVMETWASLGYISEGWFKKLLRYGSISSVPFNVQDIDNAIQIYGRPIYIPKGIMKFKKSNIICRSMEPDREPQVIYSDVMQWCKRSYLISVAAPMHLLVVHNLPNGYDQNNIFTSWNTMIQMFRTYRCSITKIISDGDSKFLAIKDTWSLGIPIEPVGANQHNSKIEVEIRIIKERLRCMMARVSWNIPGSLIDSLVIAAVSILNILPRTNDTVGPRQKLTGQFVDFEQMKYAWGQYGQGYMRNSFTNTDAFRSQGVILLYPKYNVSGSYVGINLNTKKFATVTQFEPLPAPEDVIIFMNAWYQEEIVESQMKLNKQNEKILNRELLKEKRINKSKMQDSKLNKEDIYNSVIEDERNIGLTFEDKPIFASNDYDDTVEMSSDLDVKDPTMMETDVLEPIMEETLDNIEDLNLKSTSNKYNHIDFKDGELMGNRWPNRNRNKPSKYANYGVFENALPEWNMFEEEIIDKISVNNNMIYNYSNILYDDSLDSEYMINNNGFIFLSKIKKALLEGGDLVEEAIKKEFKQLIDRNVWSYVKIGENEEIKHFNQLESRPINSLLNVVQKFDANGELIKWKARFCACGNNQDREMYDENDLSSPTMTLESVFILLAFAAQWDANIVTADITGAFLESSLEPDDVVYMFLSKDAADELKKIDPEISKYILRDGRALVRLLKALYGTLQAAKLWYKKLCKIILEYGFVQHPNDRCVFIMKLNGIVMIIGFHVDDLLMVCKCKEMIDNFVKHLLNNFNNVTVSEGKEQTYLGMLINITEGYISVSMEGYIQNILSMYELSCDNTIKDPQQDNIFIVDSTSALLSEDRRKKFHKVVYMLVYISKRVRVDLQMATSFLAGRVTIATEEDELKLFRVLRFLHNSIDEKLYYRKGNHIGSNGKSTMNVKIWADSSWGCHEDGTSRSAIIICVNDTCVSAFTNKQKIITLHATEAELVCLTDAARLGAWTRLFVEHIVRIQNDDNEILVMNLMQDNKSVIAIQSAGQRNKQRTRHLTIRLWWAQEQVEAGIARIEWVCTKEMLADFLTKALHGVAFKYCWRNISGNVEKYDDKSN